MDQGALVTEQIEGGAEFLRGFHKFTPVKIAFWLKEEEDGIWFLYIVPAQSTDENYDDGYEEVGRIADEIQDWWFNPMQVKLIWTDHPLAKAAEKVRQRCQGKKPIPVRIRNELFGGTFAQEVYIYPPQVTTS
jgi:hypothetical protein